jgi:large subunit ribosomal protein L29
VKIAEIRDQDAGALKKHEAELRKELFNLRFQAVMGTLANPSRVGQVRREIARVRTVMNEKAGA